MERASVSVLLCIRRVHAFKMFCLRACFIHAALRVRHEFDYRRVCTLSGNCCGGRAVFTSAMRPTADNIARRLQSPASSEREHAQHIKIGYTRPTPVITSYMLRRRQQLPVDVQLKRIVRTPPWRRRVAVHFFEFTQPRNCDETIQTQRNIDIVMGAVSVLVGL